MLAYAGLAIMSGSPKTMQVEIYSWANKSWGIHAVERYRTYCEVSVSSDGSRSNKCESVSFKNYVLPDGRWDWESIYNKSRNSGYTIDHAERAAIGGECMCSWTEWRVAFDDPECASALTWRAGAFERVGQGRIAGYSTIRYLSREEGERTELELAPKLGCELMKETRTWRGTLFIPGARWQYVVTSYKPGEPNADLFRLPAGYSIRTR